MGAVGSAKLLLKEHDLRTSPPHRWRKEQLLASTIRVRPSPLGHGRCGQQGSTLAYASQRSVKCQQRRRARRGKAAHSLPTAAAPVGHWGLPAFFWLFFRPSRGSRGSGGSGDEAARAFFNQLCHPPARYARCAPDAALGVAFH